MSATTSTPPRVRIPTEEEYRTVGDALQQVYNEVEVIGDVLEPLGPQPRGDELPLERTPTLEDVGALWAFIDDISTNVGQLQDKIKKLDGCLEGLNLARLDAKVQSAVQS